ncbi:hypothetical protein AB4161_22675 [Vibrio sp. 10N.286.51.E5]|uniref:hypothetical protein n=1 Tax=Vibrio sp. 10N.286.51.E5 TaxID=3229709 RepID=UPI0035502C40
MSLSKEWFEQRDQFIAQQKEQGCFTLEQALEELGTTLPYFFDLGILTQGEFTTATTNFTQLTPLGGIFFVEQYQKIFITPANLSRLKQALESWDNFTINYPLYQSDMLGKLSVRNQTHIKFAVDARRFKHKMTFRIKESRSEMAAFLSSEDTNQLLNVWNHFSQCVALIENDDKSPTNTEIATDSDAIETLCAPWHPLVQRYFRSKMNELGFEHNLNVVKQEIESKYSMASSEWSDIDSVFDMVRPTRQSQAEELPPNSSEEVEVQLITPKSVNKYGLVEIESIEATYRKVRQVQRYSPVNPGDVLLYKSADRKTVKVAYYSIEEQHTYLCSELFAVLRAKDNEHWDGKRLFLFLTSRAGQRLLEYTFRDFGVNELAQIRLSPRQLNKIQIPQLDSQSASELDDKYSQLTNLLQLKADIEQKIAILMK